MKKLMAVMLVLALIVAGLAHASNELRKSDAFIRHRVLKLFTATESCTGVEVIAPSGKHYTMSAAHCIDLVVHGKVNAEDEDGKVHQINFIGLDPSLTEK